MQAWAKILDWLPRSHWVYTSPTIEAMSWIKCSVTLVGKTRVGGGVGSTIVTIYTIHSGRFQAGWDAMANLNIFSAKKEHLILAYKCKFWAWSSNLILMCQHLKIQCKDNILKSSVVELHWLLAQPSPSEVPMLSQQTLSIHKLSPEPSASVIHLARLLLNICGTILVIQWCSELSPCPHGVYNLMGASENKQTHK